MSVFLLGLPFGEWGDGEAKGSLIVRGSKDWALVSYHFERNGEQWKMRRGDLMDIDLVECSAGAPKATTDELRP
jgi:hypothetical protein